MEWENPQFDLKRAWRLGPLSMYDPLLRVLSAEEVQINRRYDHIQIRSENLLCAISEAVDGIHIDLGSDRLVNRVVVIGRNEQELSEFFERCMLDMKGRRVRLIKIESNGRFKFELVH